ncbi:hypothetical protein NIES4071_51950 [Calothrix sp. NIES-4071]|nr:hypothetical protein NIES4071_51950 [Calothrix sp. NIES-4071]BAZ59503.1 hypothetical protein NIES4105_51900 [Calothrix sp. NIES-4105]
MPAGKFARPRLTMVLDEDVVELTKKLAELEQRPIATFAALVYSELIRELAVKEGLISKKSLVKSYKT